MMNAVRKIRILLDDRSFEYDIYTLVIAFFQGTEVHVFDPGDLSFREADLTVEVNASGRDARILVEENPAEPAAQEAPAESPAAQENPTECPSVQEVPAECPDAQERPAEKPFREERIIEAFSGLERSAQKNRLKRALYEMLRSLTGRDLPWGNLTGIRPVRLAMDFLKKEAGDGSAAAEDLIRTYYVSPRKADLAVRIAQREKKILERLRPQDHYSLYVGIPFCPSICLYCSFSSSPLGIWEKRVDDYLDALIREIEASRTCFPGKKLQTVYIGGGTPTTLSPSRMDRLLCALEDNFAMDGIAEFTVEAGRPDSITPEKLEVLKHHSVSRISINPQTMNQKTLDLIGRRHSIEQTEEAFALARSMGFDNINMDIIVGLPGEGLEEVRRTMDHLMEMSPDDITVHALALKRAARLSLHMDEYEKISFRASDEIMECTEKACEALSMSPYYLYRQKNMAGNFENVGYARPGKAGLYNILIMEEVQSILALGASGSTKIVEPDGRIWRIENVKDIRSYLERIDEMIARKDPLRTE